MRHANLQPQQHHQLLISLQPHHCTSRYAAAATHLQQLAGQLHSLQDSVLLLITAQNSSVTEQLGS
jgi:hypothetical protein